LGNLVHTVKNVPGGVGAYRDCLLEIFDWFMHLGGFRLVLALAPRKSAYLQGQNSPSIGAPYSLYDEKKSNSTDFGLYGRIKG